MRGIRGDLQDRANLFAEQICTAEDRFDKLIEQLKREQESRLADLKSGLDSVPGPRDRGSTWWRPSAGD
jgi:hypothetical protein